MELYSHSIDNRLSCFFCLRFNSKKYLNPQDESDFCGNAAEDVSTFHEFSLRNLYRFLNLLHSDKEEKDFKDLKMPICEDCFRLNGEFDKLYNLLEETKLRLNWCIQRIQDVMTKAKAVHYRVDVKVLESKEEDDDETILDIWRAHTLDRMNIVTGTSFPRIVLHKNERNWPSSSSVPELAGEDNVTSQIQRKDENLYEERIDQEETKPQLQTSSLVNPHYFENEDVKKMCHFDVSHQSTETDGMEIKMECEAKVEESYRESLERCITLKDKRKRGRPARIRASFPKVQRHKKSRKRFHSFPKSMAMVNGEETSAKTKGTQDVMEIPVILRTETIAQGKMIPYQSSSSSVVDHHNFEDEGEKRNNCCSHEDADACRENGETTIDGVTKLGEPLSESSAIQVKGQPKSHSGARGRGRPAFMSHFVPVSSNNRTKLCCKTCNITLTRSKALKHWKHDCPKGLRRPGPLLKPPMLKDPFMKEGLKTSNSNWLRRKSRKVKKNRSSKCPYCPFQCPSTYRLEGHLVCLHPEHFLIDENEKAGGLWHEEFRTILNNMIYPDFILKMDHHQSCSSCGAKYKTSDNASVSMVRMKRHLVLHHKMGLKEKLKIVLEDPSFEDKLERCKTGRKCPSNCPYCQFKCVATGANNIQNSVERHIVQFHPEHFLLEQNERDQSSGFRAGQFQTILTELVLPKFVKIAGESTSCSLCDVKYQSKSLSQNHIAIRRHLIFQHKDLLKMELGVVMDDPTLREKLNKIPSQEESEDRKLKPSSKCTYCRFRRGAAKGNQGMSMDGHLVRFHPEHFFSPALTHPQFQRILSEMIFPKFIWIAGRATNCLLCEETFKVGHRLKNVVSVRKHLMSDHKAELEESIKVVLEDPMLEENLNRSKGKGVTCSCGVYFSLSEGKAQSHHEIHHCIHYQRTKRNDIEN